MSLATGKKYKNTVVVEIIAPDGTVQRLVGHNARTDAGAAWMKDRMATASGAPALYIALSETSLTPAKGDTTLSGEITTGGLGRALGALQNYAAPSVLDGVASYEIYKQFTATLSFTLRSTGLFDAISSGNLFAEFNFSESASVANGSVINVTWTVRF